MKYYVIIDNEESAGSYPEPVEAVLRKAAEGKYSFKLTNITGVIPRESRKGKPVPRAIYILRCTGYDSYKIGPLHRQKYPIYMDEVSVEGCKRKCHPHSNPSFNRNNHPVEGDYVVCVGARQRLTEKGAYNNLAALSHVSVHFASKNREEAQKFANDFADKCPSSILYDYSLSLSDYSIRDDKEKSPYKYHHSIQGPVK